MLFVLLVYDVYIYPLDCLIWSFLLLSKNNIQQVYQKFHALLKEEFSPEDIQIIACPSMEQVSTD